MTEQDLIKKIKNLKKINPSQEWMSFARHNLISRARLSDNANNQETALGFWGWIKQFQAAALVGCLLLNILIGPWLIAKASQSSLPGDLLYAIKKVTESVQTRVASEENAIELQVEFANRRLEELNKVAQKYATADTKKIVDDFKNNLAGASQHLNNISKEKAVIVAKQTKKINEDLIKTKEEAPEEIKEELAEAERAIEDIKFRILAVLTKDENNDMVATSSDEEILIYLKGETATSSERRME